MMCPADGDQGHPQGGELLAAISNQIVQLLRESTGRGPTQCKTYWVGDDIVMVVIKGGFSAAEQTMADAGHEDEVFSGRRALQSSVSQRMKDIVETNVGRDVEAFMSNSHMDPNLMIEVFVLKER